MVSLSKMKKTWRTGYDVDEKAKRGEGKSGRKKRRDWTTRTWI